MNKLGLVFFFIACSYSQLANATLVEIVCPCEVRTGDQTSVIVKAGALNRDTSTSGELRLRILYHETKSFFNSGAFVMGVAYFNSTLASSASLPVTEIKTGITPSDGTFFVTLLLEEKQSGTWTRVDSKRMETPVVLSSDFGESVNSSSGALYFDGTPTISIEGGQVTVNLPAIVNGSDALTTGTLEARIIQSDNKTIFGFFFTAATQSLGSTLSPSSQLAASTFTVSFSEQPDEGFDFFHLIIVDLADESVESDDSFLMGQTVKVNTGSITTRSFSLAGVDLLLTVTVMVLLILMSCWSVPIRIMV